MKNALFIDRIVGIKIFLHWTFPIIIFWIIFSNLRRGLNAEQVTWSVVFILALFVCVTLHELGHALAARRYHIQTRDITSTLADIRLILGVALKSVACAIIFSHNHPSGNLKPSSGN